MVITIFKAERVTRASDNGDRRKSARIAVAGSGYQPHAKGCSRDARSGHAEYPHDLGFGTVHFFSHSSLKKVPVEFGCSCTNQIGIQ